jgi:hypothetical protein
MPVAGDALISPRCDPTTSSTTGCGDGRIVIAAAARRAQAASTSTSGSPRAANARKAGVIDRIRFRRKRAGH